MKKTVELSMDVAKEYAGYVIRGVNVEREERKQAAIDREIWNAARPRLFGLRKGKVITKEEAWERVLDNEYLFSYGHLYQNIYKDAQDLISTIETLEEVDLHQPISVCIRFISSARRWRDYLEEKMNG